jgi:ubiquitin-protein ligase
MLTTTHYLQIEKNTNVLLEVQHNVIRRRLKIEIDRMYPHYNEIIVSLNELNKLQITIFEYDTNNNRQKYDFIIGEDYPFKSPEIFFQNRYYFDFLRIYVFTKKEFARFKKVTGKECFCCHSITCMNNWGPATTLTNIIEEIRHIRKMKRDIINNLLAEKIKQKYLVSDIDLESWLY